MGRYRRGFGGNVQLSISTGALLPEYPGASVIGQRSLARRESTTEIHDGNLLHTTNTVCCQDRLLL